MTIDEINKQFTFGDIAQQTAQQITKDFGLYRIAVEFDNNCEPTYDLLMSLLRKNITSIVQMDRQKLRAILYQVDVAPKILNELGQMSELEQIDFVAHQVIVRELKKVLSRLYYKQKKENEGRLAGNESDEAHKIENL